MEHVTSVTIKYDEFAVNADELRMISDTFTELAPTKSRVQFIERGGEETRIWVYMTIVGITFKDEIKSFVIQTILSTALEKFKDLSKRINPTIPSTLITQFDDIDLFINVPNDYSKIDVNETILRIQKELKRKPLKKEMRIDRILVPYRLDPYEGWEHYFYDKAEQFDTRYWGIDYVGGYTESVFDSKTLELISIPYPDWAPNPPRKTSRIFSQLKKLLKL